MRLSALFGRCGAMRRGASLVDVIVTVSLMAVLASIALPACIAARASMRRLSCANNLRQIGLAVHGFEQSNRAFPNFVCGILHKGALFQPYCLSPHAQILPWAAPGTASELIDWEDAGLDYPGHPASKGTNTTAMQTRISLWNCPGDGLAARRAGTNYRFNSGVEPRWPKDSGGLFCYYKPFKPSDVTDGLSQTALASERLQGDGGSANDPARNALTLLPSLNVDIIAGCGLANGGAVPLTGYEDHYLGTSWLRGGRRHVLYFHVLPPNSRFIDCHVESDGIFSARSLHAGGVNVLFADGRIAFAANDIDQAVWHAAATRSGNETVDAKW